MKSLSMAAGTIVCGVARRPRGASMTKYTLSVLVPLGLAGLISTGCSAESTAAPASIEAVAAAGTTLVYGINHDDFNSFNCKIPDGIHGYRVYRDSVITCTADDTPDACSARLNTQWPNDLRSDYSTLSLRIDPDTLLSGRLDAALNELMDTAPDHAELTVWHEAGPGNPLSYPATITAASVTAMHAHMQALVTAHGHVKYGQIITGPANQMVDWLGKGLDWYGVDIYDNPTFENNDGTLSQDKIDNRMDNNKATFALVSNGTPSIRITETNSNMDNHRKNWYLFLSEWMVANNGFRMLLFFHADGALSGPWPPSPTVIDYINSTLIPEFGRDPTFVNPCVQ